ncbi:MAG TPA: TetR/AcrR family transcriptional regulator [Mariprofundaceae bacterium]|nr:TetR/AcrR family transcriptional regulator [Mariprofundaceae bacterium]
MSNSGAVKMESGVRKRLLEAAMHAFLDDDYQSVSMRRVAQQAKSNMSMIYYYFGNKEGLFEEVLRSWLQPLIDNMQSPDGEASPDSIEDFFRMYYRAALAEPRFPLLIMKTINSSDAPGARFLCETVLERGRQSGLVWGRRMQAEGKIAPDVDLELLRIAVVSMSMMPMLIRDFLAKQQGEPIDSVFFDRLSAFYTRIMTHGIVQPLGEE